MGKKSTELVSMDVKEVAGGLIKAYADEWPAFYQYMTLATIATGR
ncbi:MAG: hypothetical protein ACFFD4_29530 [Candidatus Odinarchaeota archaeon]